MKAPLIRNFLGVAEGVATNLLHMDFAIEKKVTLPKLKKLDDFVFNPIIQMGCRIARPVLTKAGVILQPVMCAVVPRIFGVLGYSKEAAETCTHRIDPVMRKNSLGECDSDVTNTTYCNEGFLKGEYELAPMPSPPISLSSLDYSISEERSNICPTYDECQPRASRPSKKNSRKKKKTMFALFSKQKHVSKRCRNRLDRHRLCGVSTQPMLIDIDYGNDNTEQSPVQSEEGETELIKEAIKYISGEDCVNLNNAFHFSAD